MLEQNLEHIDSIKAVSANYGNSQVNIEHNAALLSLAGK